MKFAQLLQKEKLRTCSLCAFILISAHYLVRRKFDYIFLDNKDLLSNEHRFSLECLKYSLSENTTCSMYTSLLNHNIPEKLFLFAAFWLTPHCQLHFISLSCRQIQCCSTQCRAELHTLKQNLGNGPGEYTAVQASLYKSTANYRQLDCQCNVFSSSLQAKLS